MENRSSQLRSPGLIAAFVALLLALCALMCPAAAMADEESVAHSVDASGGITGYKTIEEALAAGYEGKTIYMDTDWKVEGITIEEGKNLKIDMYGHKIACTKGSASSVINIGKGAQLTLTSSQKAEFWYRSFSGLDGSASYSLTSTGGLVTNGDQQNVEDIKFTGIEVGENATLSLDGVTIAGCYGDDEEDDNRPGGGITMRKFSTLNMVNGATIEGNKSRMHGAGVYVAGSDSTVNIDNSSISRNYSCERGGGIGISGHRVVVNMSNDAHIDNNSAQAGGGIICFSASCTLRSVDGKATVSGNRALSSNRTTVKWAQSGGGIHITGTSEENPNVLIENITIADNYSAYDGGGLELDYKGVTLRNCIITGNTCKYEGGGIYVCDDGETIDGCTITGNACSVDSGGNYEGGGVFVWHSYDIKLAGKCIIKGNTRGKGTDNADDVMLREDWWTSTKAYITGSLEKGSSVGVRTGTTGDRRIAKNFKPDTKDCLFYDMDGYYVSYGTDEGGDAWQRHRTLEFAAKVSGEEKARYKWKAPVALSVPAAKDGKVFWRWDAKYTTGLNPFSDYFSEKGAFSNAVAFTMPQNDVNLVPLYVDKVTSALFAVQAPEAGNALSTTGQLVRTDDGASGSATVPCAVYWYEVGEDGKETYVVGNAKANTTYKAYLSAPEVAAKGLYYSDSITEKNVKVRMISSSEETVAEPTDAYVTLSNSLAAKTVTYKTGAGKDVETKTVEVQLKNKGLVGNGEGEANAVALMADGDAQADDTGLVGTVQISCAYNEDTDAVTLTAPAREGYNFCNWEATGDADVSDEGVVTIPVADFLKIKSLTAVYTPVATSLDVKLDAPVAGDPLAATCADIEATCSDEKTVSLKTGFNVDSFEVAWSPVSQDGKAGYSTAYTALIKLCDGEGFEDVEKALAAAAKVTCNGTEATSAGFTVKDSKLYLAVTFPATATAQAKDIIQPADVELTFEEAKACAEEGSWPLQKAVDVEAESGVTAEGDIAWEDVEGFDANATGAQELIVEGKVAHIATADGNKVNTDNVSLDVDCKIKIAAPAQGGEDGGKTPAANPDDGNGQPVAGDEGDGQPASGDTDNKSALAKTSDAIPVLAVAVVVAIAIAAIAVAIVAARRSRNR